MADTNFTVEAIVSCDDRGQLVLPKELRKKLNISSGQKMALINYRPDDKSFCLTLIRADSLEDLIKNYLGPVLKDMVK